jgi:hypothetical protein
MVACAAAATDTCVVSAWDYSLTKLFFRFGCANRDHFRDGAASDGRRQHMRVLTR